MSAVHETTSARRVAPGLAQRRRPFLAPLLALGLARAGLAAGSLATMGALLFCVLGLDPANPAAFGAIWALVFAGSLIATLVGNAVASIVWSSTAGSIATTIAANAILRSSGFMRSIIGTSSCRQSWTLA